MKSPLYALSFIMRMGAGIGLISMLDNPWLGLLLIVVLVAGQALATFLIAKDKID